MQPVPKEAHISHEKCCLKLHTQGNMARTPAPSIFFFWKKKKCHTW